MKKYLIALLLVVMASVASVCMGFVGGPQYEVEYKAVKVVSGLTLWEIADANYEECKARGMCFAEYEYNLRHVAANEYLTANGRVLQVGDRVLVPVYKVKK